MWLRSCCGHKGKQTCRSSNEPTGQMGRQTHKQILPGRTASITYRQDKRESPPPSRPTPPRDALTLPQAGSLCAATKKKVPSVATKTHHSQINKY